MTTTINVFLRGEIYFVNFGNRKGSVQRGVRPALILQNDIGNKYSTTVTVAPLTTEFKDLPTHVMVQASEMSQVLVEQIQCVSKDQIREYICKLGEKDMELVANAIKLQLWIDFSQSKQQMCRIIDDLIDLIKINKTLKRHSIRNIIRDQRTMLYPIHIQELSQEYKNKYKRIMKY